jgi:hypothetical protein
VGKDKPVLVILDYDYMSATSEEIKVVKVTAFAQKLAEKTERRTQRTY